jgi:pyruvate dehydrogenase E2 component (dihydrolipoamide acetyltransferase)
MFMLDSGSKEVDIIMPRLDPEMKEGRIVEWLKKEGDSVRKGEIIARIETEKTIAEMEAPDSGILSKILVKEGELVPVGSKIAIIMKTG